MNSVELENKLILLKKNFLTEKISKQEFIKEMYKFHKILFEYSEFISNTDIKKIEIMDDNIIMTTRDLGVKIYCTKYDERTLPIEILNFERFEGKDSKMIFNLVQDGFTVFDIGANIGWYSLALAKLRDDLNIFSFEPIPKTFKILQKNIKLNKFKNIKQFNHGFYSKNTELQFYYNKDDSGNASSINLRERKDAERIKCNMITLDHVIDYNKIKKIDFIKCDVEGGELFVFEGGKKSISKLKPIVFTEMLRNWSSKFNYHPNRIIELFAKHGYSCFISSGDYLKQIDEIDENTIETNFLFLHRNKHNKQISKLVKS